MTPTLRLYKGILDCGHDFVRWMSPRRAQVGMSHKCHRCPMWRPPDQNPTEHISRISTITEIPKEA